MFSPAGQPALQGGKQVDVDRPALAHRTGARVPVHQIGQRRHVPPGTGHTGRSRMLPNSSMY